MNNKEFQTQSNGLSTNNLISNSEQTCAEYGLGRIIYSIFHILLTITSIYLSVRCNGYNFIDLLFAFMCPYLYIIYSIIQYNGICNANN